MKHLSKEGYTKSNAFFVCDCQNIQKEQIQPLNLVTELQADPKVREVATVCGDDRLLALTARDIVAAEAHYHPSCYWDYTRPNKMGKVQN